MEYNIRRAEVTMKKMWAVAISITVCNFAGLGFALADFLIGTCSYQFSVGQTAVQAIAQFVFFIVWVVPILIALWPNVK